MEFISDPQAWIALLTLSTLEIVLGVDNLVFISIAVGNLPHDFDPATWLEENAADLTIVATEAAKEVVYEALELGLGWCL